MTEIGIGLIGGGYMGKAHAVAYAAVAAVFNTPLRPTLEMIAATSPQSAEAYRKAYGFARAAQDWQDLVADPKVGAVIIASPQSTHRAIAEAAFAAGKPVFCEKPLGASLGEARAMVAAAEASGLPNMIGFNYVRTPATQFVRHLLAEGAIGTVTWFRGEHTEDFLADPTLPATWRTTGRANGTMGDLAPHPINCTLALMGDIAELSARIETIHHSRPSPEGPRAVDNDDHAQLMLRFASGAGPPRLCRLLSGTGAWHRLSGPDHHRGAGFPDRHCHGATGLADVSGRACRGADHRHRLQGRGGRPLAQRPERLKGAGS